MSCFNAFHIYIYSVPLPSDPVSYYNPLHISVLRNKPHMVQLLVGHGANIDKRDRIHESSPLDLASEEADRLPCLRVLLDLGADINAKDKNGKTALLHAFASSDGLTVNNTCNIQLLPKPHYHTTNTIIYKI
uniref:Uncharacterized protein n=1 Tax=Astyanax mexicanus TaxID=7994 RepID=A0A8B9GS94_ASTMX